MNVTTDTVKIDTRREEARTLRERIYGPLQDASWEKVAENWVKDLDWLRRVARDGKI